MWNFKLLYLPLSVVLAIWNFAHILTATVSCSWWGFKVPIETFAKWCHTLVLYCCKSVKNKGLTCKEHSNDPWFAKYVDKLWVSVGCTVAACSLFFSIILLILQKVTFNLLFQFMGWAVILISFQELWRMHVLSIAITMRGNFLGCILRDKCSDYSEQHFIGRIGLTCMGGAWLCHAKYQCWVWLGMIFGPLLTWGSW